MTKTLLLIGIGPGDPDALTLAALRAIQRVDVFFFLEKEGDGKDSLIRFRKEILARHRGDRPYRIASGMTPRRDRESPDYAGAVEDWRRRRTGVIGELLEGNLAEGEVGGFLLWGDPALYDGTIQNLQALIDDGRTDLDYEVIPGISSLQMLTARHKVTLNRVGESIVVTTGRQLEAMDPAEVSNTFVMLDSRSAFQRLRSDPDLEIYWGGDLGGPDEVLIAGPLDAVADDIDAAIRRQREKKGWIMDSYLLRRRHREGVDKHS